MIRPNLPGVDCVLSFEVMFTLAGRILKERSVLDCVNHIISDQDLSMNGHLVLPTTGPVDHTVAAAYKE